MVSSLLGLSPSEWDCDEKALNTALAIVHEMMAELMTLAREMGYDDSFIPSNTPDTIVESVKGTLRGTDFVPSALLDVRLKIPFELEVILGYPLREAQARKLSTPVSVRFPRVLPANPAHQRLELVYRLLSVVQAHLLTGHAK